MKSTIRALLVLTIFAAWLSVIAAQDQFPDGTAISLLQRKRFVPRYDEWFDRYIRDCARRTMSQSMSIA